MTVLTDSERTLINTYPQQTNLYMSVYQPDTVLACRVNSTSLKKGSRSITFDGTTVGSYSNVKSGMTMWIGTSAGAKDVGRIRVRSATSTVITVAENQDIVWANDLYLTIVNYWEIWSVFPRQVQNTTTSDSTITFYTDYDTAYTTQNAVLGSMVCAGQHYAGFLENGSCNVYFSSTGTYNVLGQNLTYAWTFYNATGTSTAATPGNISYTTPGHYRVTLAVTNTAGGVDTVYRFVSIYNKPNEGNVLPILTWGVDALNGNISSGGYTAKVWVEDNASILFDGALVIIWSENWYGNTKQSIGGMPNRSNIFFEGYIEDGSINFDADTSKTFFTLVSPTELMKSKNGFSIAIDSKTSAPGAWTEIQSMTWKKAMYSAIRYYSTLNMATDIRMGGTDIGIEYFDTGKTNLYDAYDKFMQMTRLGRLLCDRSGTVWIVEEPKANSFAYTQLPTSMLIDRQNYLDTVSITEQIYPAVAQLELGGFSFKSGVSRPFLSAAPSAGFLYSGKITQSSGLAVTDQNELNRICGAYFTYDNARYQSVNMQLAGNYGNLDIAPVEKVLMNLLATDTDRGIIWTSKPFHVTDISWSIDSENGIVLPEITIHELPTTSITGTMLRIPDIPIPNTPPSPIDPDYPIIPGLTGFFPIDPFPWIFPIIDMDCNDEENGPFPVIISPRIIYNGISSTNTPCIGMGGRPHITRANTYNYDSAFTLVGNWQTGGDASAWTDTSTNTWWSVRLLDENGNYTSTATLDPVIDPEIRTGQFLDLTENTENKYVEIKITEPAGFSFGWNQFGEYDSRDGVNVTVSSAGTKTVDVVDYGLHVEIENREYTWTGDVGEEQDIMNPSCSLIFQTLNWWEEFPPLSIQGSLNFSLTNVRPEDCQVLWYYRLSAGGPFVQLFDFVTAGYPSTTPVVPLTLISATYVILNCQIYAHSGVGNYTSASKMMFDSLEWKIGAASNKRIIVEDFYLRNIC